MNKERLLVLANFLEKDVPDDQFDMSIWVEDAWEGAQDLSCGAAACAIGWCPQVPAFKDLGLHYVRWPDGVHVTMEGIAYIRGDISMSMRTAEALFGLDSEQVRHLFLPSAYANEDDVEPEHVPRKMVVTRIREFVACPTWSR
jgi:hypothetical protein